jgi:hypothetical protein
MSRSRQVIDSGISDRIKNTRISAGSVAQKIGSRQALAELKRKVSDAGHAVGDGNAGQPKAIPERTISDACDAVGNRDAGQAAAARERLVPYVGDAVGDRDAGQAAAARERTVPDASRAAVSVFMEGLSSTTRQPDRLSCAGPSSGWSGVALLRSFGVRTNHFGFTICWATNASVVVEVFSQISSPPTILARTAIALEPIEQDVDFLHLHSFQRRSDAALANRSQQPFLQAWIFHPVALITQVQLGEFHLACRRFSLHRGSFFNHATT